MFLWLLITIHVERVNLSRGTLNICSCPYLSDHLVKWIVLPANMKISWRSNWFKVAKRCNIYGPLTHIQSMNFIVPKLYTGLQTVNAPEYLKVLRLIVLSIWVPTYLVSQEWRRSVTLNYLDKWGRGTGGGGGGGHTLVWSVSTLESKTHRS